MKIIKLKQIFIGLVLLLSLGMWGQKNASKDSIILKSASEFKNAIKKIKAPDYPNGNCFSVTISRSGGRLPNGGYWVSMFRKEIKLTIQNGWNLRPTNWPSNIRVISSTSVGNIHTYVLESTVTGTFNLPIMLQNGSDYPCYGNIEIYLQAEAQLLKKTMDTSPRTP